MSGSIDYSVLFPTYSYSSGTNESDGLLGALYGTGKSGSTTNPLQALRSAETNETRDVALTAKQPQVARDLTAFRAAVAKAKTPAELLKNPIAMKVLLTAGGLADQVDYTALAQRALLSNTKDKTSLVNKLAATNSRWKPFVQTYDFANKGLSILKQPKILASVANAFAEVTWRESLDATTPGLSSALTFRAQASSVTSVIQILGDPILRDVITTALNIPKQIAFQSIPTQEHAISTRLNLAKLKDKHFVDTLTQEYLLNKASSTSQTGTQATLDQLASRSAGLVV